MATTKRDTCINTLLEVFPKEIMKECKRITKLEQLCHKNRGGHSNNKDGRQGGKDKTVPGLTTGNNENNDGTVSNTNNKWVINLSGQPLTEAEYKVLTHRPNFAVTSRSPHSRMHHCH